MLSSSQQRSLLVVFTIAYCTYYFNRENYFCNKSTAFGLFFSTIFGNILQFLQKSIFPRSVNQQIHNIVYAFFTHVGILIIHNQKWNALNIVLFYQIFIQPGIYHLRLHIRI